MSRILDDVKPSRSQRQQVSAAPGQQGKAQTTSATEVDPSEILASANFDGDDDFKKKSRRKRSWAERTKNLRLMHHFNYEKDLADKAQEKKNKKFLKEDLAELKRETEGPRSRRSLPIKKTVLNSAAPIKPGSTTTKSVPATVKIVAAEKVSAPDSPTLKVAGPPHAAAKTTGLSMLALMREASQ